jgi:hypothetical protein
LDVIINNLYQSKENIELINCITEGNRNIFNPSYMSGVNRVVSYMTYILGEICNFINIKVNGHYVTEINDMLNQINLLKEKNKLIKNKI